MTNMSNPDRRYIEFDRYRLDLEERTLLRDGERVVLAQKSYEVLLRLVDASGKLVRHDELMRSVWQQTAVDQANLKQSIALIRKALGDNPEAPRFIQTVPKYGYRFIAPVSVLPDEDLVLVAERRSVMEIDFEEEIGEARSLPPADTGRHWRPFIAGASVLVLIAALIVPVWLYLRNRTGTEAARPTFAVDNIVPRKVTESGDIEGGVLSPNGEFAVYNTIETGGVSTIWLRQIESREAIRIVSLDAPEAVGAVSITHDGNWIYFVTTKNGEWGAKSTLFRVSILGGKPQKVAKHIDGFVSFSPDDSQFVFNRFRPGGCELTIASSVDGSGERVIEKGSSSSEFLHPQWSPDGTRILFFNVERRIDGNYWSLATIPKDGGQRSVIIQPGRQRIWFNAWTREGGIVINATDQATFLPQIFTVDEATGELTRVTNDLFYYSGVSVGGNSILATKIERPSAVWVADSDNGFAAPRKLTTETYSDSLDWMPDGRIIFDARDAIKRHVWAITSDGTSRDLLTPDKFDDMAADVSPDGSRMVFVSDRSGWYEIWVSGIDGSDARQVTFRNRPVWMPRFAPDGRSVYYDIYEDNVHSLNNVSLEDGSVRRVIGDVSIDFFDISPDGRFVAFSYFDKETNQGRVALRSIETGETAKVFDVAPARFLRFTGDGTALLFKNADVEKGPPSSIWIQPLDGSPARQLVDFKSEDVYMASLSPDGKKLAALRGHRTSDLILLSAKPK